MSNLREQLSHVKIEQFVPKSKRSDVGTYGWGFDIDNFRFLIYGPEEANTDDVSLIEKKMMGDKHHGRRKARDFSHVREKSEGIRLGKPNRQELDEPTRKKEMKHTQFNEHPPAHVHVIQLSKEQRSTTAKMRRNNRFEDINPENRYELIENEDGSASIELMSPIIKEDGSMSRRAENRLAEMIDARHNNMIQQVLDAKAAEFIACWRKLYSPQSYSPEQVAKNPIFEQRLDRFVTESTPLKTGSGPKKYLRRLERPDESEVGYYRPGDKRPHFRYILPPKDDKIPPR